MTLVVADRVKQGTLTTGTGTLTLSGSLLGFQTFAVIGDGNTTYYTIVDSNDGSWEVGVGTYTASGTTLSRDTVLDSSNAGSLVDFAAGTKEVFVTYPADKAVYELANGDVSLPSDLAVGGAVDAGGAITAAEDITAGGLVTGDNFNNTNVFYYNTRTVLANKTISGTENALSVGPIAINTGVTVTIDVGGEWTIV
jgi:hypothetical protein